MIGDAKSLRNAFLAWSLAFLPIGDFLSEVVENVGAPVQHYHPWRESFLSLCSLKEKSALAGVISG